MTYGSAIVPQTGHWLLSAGPFRHPIPAGVGKDGGVALDSTSPVNSGSWARAIPRPEISVSQNFFLVIVMRVSPPPLNAVPKGSGPADLAPPASRL